MLLHLLIICYSIVLFPACSKKPLPEPQKKLDIIHTSLLPTGWYTQDAVTLNNELELYLNEAQKHFYVDASPNSVHALIAPHAGYYFSGLCAATAYQTLRENGKKNKNISRVIILSPSHTVFMNGVSLPDYTIYRTTLGEIPVDQDAIAALRKHMLFQARPEAHDKEHAVEMQLPFLQKTVADFKIVPLIIGHLKDNDPLFIAQEIKKLIDNQTLVVISTDFVHYGKNYNYTPFFNQITAQIGYIDSLAVQTLWLQLSPAFNQLLKESGATICGQEPLKVFLALMGLKTWGTIEGQLSCYYTSAQMQQARQKDNTIMMEKLFEKVPDPTTQSSVSYAGMVFTDTITQQLTGYEKKALTNLARATLENYFKSPNAQLADHLLYPIISSGIDQKTGAFVTLKTKDGQLRGCIGRILSSEPLYKTVHAMTLAAAFNDSRFVPIIQDDLAHITLSITILTQPVKVANYHDIIIGKHGIVLYKKNPQGNITATAVFLPQVAIEQKWDREKTLEQLSIKAGLSSNSWKTDCDFEVFEGYEIYE